MWRLHEKTAPHEAALERALVPDEPEMSRIIKWSDFLTRRVERKIRLLKEIQKARREKERSG